MSNKKWSVIALAVFLIIVVGVFWWSLKNNKWPTIPLPEPTPKSLPSAEGTDTPSNTSLGGQLYENLSDKSLGNGLKDTNPFHATSVNPYSNGYKNPFGR